MFMQSQQITIYLITTTTYQTSKLCYQAEHGLCSVCLLVPLCSCCKIMSAPVMLMSLKYMYYVVSAALVHVLLILFIVSIVISLLCIELCHLRGYLLQVYTTQKIVSPNITLAMRKLFMCLFNCVMLYDCAPYRFVPFIFSRAVIIQEASNHIHCRSQTCSLCLFCLVSTGVLSVQTLDDTGQLRQLSMRTFLRNGANLRTYISTLT